MSTKESNTADREIKISRLFDAPLSLVWEVWTKPEHLKNWWGPNGFTNTIHTMDVVENGEWNLTMHGPDGTDYENKTVYKEIVFQKKIVYDHISNPRFLTTVEFESRDNKTLIQWHMLFESHEQFVQVVKTFKADEGLKQNVDKLNLYLQTQQNLRQQFKKTPASRVTTYLNFPGNTEAAFNFYKDIFKTEFPGDGIRRFGDIKHPEGTPPFSEEDKNLIIYIELPILGGHILMATDAPESMGFKLEYGNNIFINLEPDSKKETKRLFDALSSGGNITMELQDMFWGAYFGTCTDKYGINWMFNFINASN